MAKAGPRGRSRQDHVAVVILGMHRSGGGLLAQLLQLAGLSPAARGGPAAAPSRIAALNDRILEEVGSRWDAPRILAVRGQGPASGAIVQCYLRDRFLRQATQAIAEDFGTHPAIVVDDPRVCLFLPLWEAALRSAGYDPRPVLIFRNPLEVTGSFRAAHTLPPPRVHQLWLRYNLAVLAHHAGRPKLPAVSFDELMADGLAALRRLQRELALPAGLPKDLRATLRGVIDPQRRHFTVPDDDVLQSDATAPLLKSVLSLLRAWRDLPPERRRTEAAAAQAGYEAFALLAGIAVTLPAPRPLIVHYHLFKNAGTSVDAVLEQAFGARWAKQEYPNGKHAEQQPQLATLLADNPDLLAVSSHTLVLPLPATAGLHVHPVMFVRHPLDRLKSAYEFERHQQADTTGAKLARAQDFAGYLRAHLALPHDRTSRNFQAHRLAMGWPGPPARQAERALRVLNLLPFVGLVDAFDASMARLEAWLAPTFPEFRGFSVHLNATAAPRPLADRLADIRAELGDDLYDTLLEANQADLTVYEAVRARYA